MLVEPETQIYDAEEAWKILFPPEQEPVIITDSAPHSSPGDRKNVIVYTSPTPHRHQHLEGSHAQDKNKNTEIIITTASTDEHTPQSKEPSQASLETAAATELLADFKDTACYMLCVCTHVSMCV